MARFGGIHRLGVALLGIGLLMLPAAWAGTACIQTPLTPERLANAARLGVKVFDALEASQAQVVVIGRVGTDLSKYGLHFSHVGFAVRDYPQGRWTVIHLLNRCGTDTSSLYNEGLINFFLDDPFVYEAVIAVPVPAVQQAVGKALRSRLVWRLHQPHYNTIARPQSAEFQNSNQWLLELTAAALANGTITARSQVWESPLMQSYQPDVVQIDRLSRIGGGLFKANLTFTDHPLADRLKGAYPTVTVRSVIRFLYQTQQLDRLQWIGLSGAPRTASGAELPAAIARL